MLYPADSFNYSRVYSAPGRLSLPALFLDRDGVVIEDVHYISDPTKVKLCSGARDLISHAVRNLIPVVLITNQSGISRGFFSWHDFHLVNLQMLKLLGPQAQLSAIYACGHSPTDFLCGSWRKPSPLMLLEASNALNLDLSRSILIGDRLSDLQAGASAGLACLFHVLTGHGVAARPSVLEWHSIAKYNCFCDSDAPKLTLIDTLSDFPFPLLTSMPEPSL